MASYKFTPVANLGTVTLGGSGYTAASGTMVLASGQGANLPTAGDFWLEYDTGSGIRIFKVTARSTDTLTVTPDATEGIGDGSIAAAATLKAVTTCAALTQLKSDIVALGGLVLLKTLTASSSASLDFATRTDGTAIIQSDFDEYLISFINLIPATGNVTLNWRMSTNGGSSYDSSAIYDEMEARMNPGANGVGGSSNGTSIPLGRADNIATTSTGGLGGSMRLIDPGSSATHKRVFGQLLLLSNAGSWTHMDVGGAYKSATAVNAFQFFMSSGNITSGSIRVYGIAKT